MAVPALIAALRIFGPWVTDPVLLFGGVAFDHRPGWLPGFSTFDPNQGSTAYALGRRAALDLLSGTLPLWNPFEGMGAPLLGEMQSAALFPPTLLLLLPHGQVLEHGLLQVVAGLGTFLFLRRVGLDTTAALAGGLLFECNGVMAWMRNAIYNPVAFLPWLFLAIEWLRAGERWRGVCGGALAASLALYAGFPEIVYLYTPPLVLWALLRARRAIPDLLLLALLALLLAAPVLLAFARYLPEADVAAHHDGLFRNESLRPFEALTLALPYVFGPLSWSARPAIEHAWDSGGYLGTAPLLLGLMGVWAGRRRPAIWVLAGWTAFAVLVTFGVQPLIRLFTLLPFAADTTFCRYLAAGWVFCCAALAAWGVEHAPSLRRPAVPIAAALILLAWAAVLAWPPLRDLWGAGIGGRRFIIASVVAAALALLLPVLFRRSRAVLCAVLAAEAILAFLVPLLSAPRSARLDRELIDFLRGHVGLQRVAVLAGNRFMPNFGSVFGIPSLNFDDLPVPARAAAYVHDHLDPGAVSFLFHPAAAAAVGRDRIAARLPAYAAAGVRYVLGDPDMFAEPLNPLRGGPATALPLSAGQSLTFAGDWSVPGPPVAAVSLSLGTYAGLADGRLRVQLCQAERCAEAALALAGFHEGAPALLPLTPALPREAGRYRLSVTKEGGRHEVALWTRPDAGPAGTMLPDIGLVSADAPAAVLQTPTATVFELPAPRPYASAPGCRLAVESRETMMAECAAPSRLTRLELLMAGWTAQVDGADAPITLADEAFQSVALPAGRSTVRFRYAPAGVRPAAWLALLTLAGIAGSGVLRHFRLWRPPLFAPTIARREDHP